MDRKQALEQLEVIRSGSDDWSDPELADALAALEGDPEARRELDRRLQLDAKIADALKDVDVPSDLKERLVAAVISESQHPAPAAAPTNQPGAAQPSDPPKTRRRSRRQFVSTALAIGVIAAVSVWLLQEEPTVSYLTIRDAAPRDAAAVISQATATVRDATPVPELNLPVAISRIPGTARIGWTAPDSEVASLVLARANWVLVVTPREQVVDVPDLEAGGTVGGNRNGYWHGAWRDEQFVYVLFVKGQRRDFENVWQRQFRGATA